MRNRTKFFQASLGAMLLAWTFAALPVHAQDGCDDPGQHVEAIPGPTPTPGPKHWDPGYDIGTVLDEDGRPVVDENGPVTDGHMTAPEDYTQPAVERVEPKVKVGKLLACSAEHASDPDKWTRADNDNNPCTEDPTGYENDPTTCIWTCTGGQFVHVDAEGHVTVIGTTVTGLLATWQAPSTPGPCSIKCSSDDTPTAVNLPETGDRDDKALEYSCNVIVYKLSVQFVNTEVAAGAVASPAHQADFKVTASDGENGVPGVNVDQPEVTDGGLGLSSTKTASAILTDQITGSDGTAKGVFTSGNRTQDTTITVYNSSTGDKSSASISQIWNGLSPDVAWSFDPYFDYDESSTVSYNLFYFRDGAWKGIDGHNFEFLNTSVSGWQWSDSAGADEDGDGIPDGDYVYKTYSADDDDLTGWTTYNGLSEWSGVSGDAGVYSSDETIWWDDDFVLDSVDFNVQDDSVLTLHTTAGN